MELLQGFQTIFAFDTLLLILTGVVGGINYWSIAWAFCLYGTGNYASVYVWNGTGQWNFISDGRLRWRLFWRVNFRHTAWNPRHALLHCHLF